VIADHEEAAIPDLDHFVAIEDRMMPGGSWGDPIFVDTVAEAAMADESVLLGVSLGKDWLDPDGSDGGTEACEEMAAGRHAFFKIEGIEIGLRLEGVPWGGPGGGPEESVGGYFWSAFTKST
jgi:hypothetical protein